MAKEWKDDLEELCEKITEEISEANKKLEKTGGKMTAGDLEYIDKLTHALKSIKTTLAMAEADDEYSDEYSGARGGRGRGSNARRDSMGRYSREMRGGNSYAYEGGRSNNYSGYSGRGYSRDDARSEMMEQLRDIEMSARDDRTRRMVQEWIRQAERE